MRSVVNLFSVCVRVSPSLTKSHSKPKFLAPSPPSLSPLLSSLLTHPLHFPALLLLHHPLHFSYILLYFPLCLLLPSSPPLTLLCTFLLSEFSSPRLSIAFHTDPPLSFSFFFLFLLYHNFFFTLSSS